MRSRIVVGTRGSRLALIQTESVVAKLKQSMPDVEVQIVKIATQGDRNQHIQLEQVEGTGFFVKELEDALLYRRIDLAVHSLKDVPGELPKGLALASVPERADPRDVLVTRGLKLAELPPGAKIGTSSLRRSVQLAALRPDLEPTSIRGNVDTRVRKVDSDEYDGLITAAAALVRLGLQDRITEYFPFEDFLPDAGQGALVVETRQSDEELNKALSYLNDVPAWQSVTAERAFQYALGGGCRAPIAALGTVEDGVLKLEGMIANVAQKRILRDTEVGNVGSAAQIGKRLAQKLLDSGGIEFINKAKSE